MFYDRFIRPLLFRMDPERVHRLTLRLLEETPLATLVSLVTADVERPVEVWGLTFRNPVGLAAGFDKDCRALRAWRALGFGFVEIGTVTRFAQAGNPRPRVFRCRRERALVNRLGFPNEGAEVIARRLEAYRRAHDFSRFPIGVNIGKSKVTPLEEAGQDYLETFRAVYPWGDFFVVNVSSPNTPGLRELQRADQLRPVIESLQAHAAAHEKDTQATKRKPLLVKIAPDLDTAELLELLALIEELSVDGVVATNTTIDHSGVALREDGGVSGAPLRRRSTEIVRRIAKETGGKLPIVAVGGVFDRDDFREKIDAGATLVETYTGFVYQGPRIVGRLLRE